MTSMEEQEANLDWLPSGFKFKPTDVELVDYYLKKKVNNKQLPPSKIKEVQLYNYDPETLTGISNNKSSNGSVDEWYFFTPRDRKYKNGKRPARAAADGYWKATGADKDIKYEGKLLGSKKTLVFYKGKPPKGDKTNWIMHEFVLTDPPKRKRNGDDDMRLDDWVLCRLYKKQNAKSEPGTLQQEQGDDEEQEEAADANTPDQTETRVQEYHGIPPAQPEHFQDNDFNVVPQQTCPMPSYNPSAYGGGPQFRQCYNAYNYSDGLPQFPDPWLQHYSTIIPGQAVSDYGNFMPRVAPPMASMPPAPISSMPPAPISPMPPAPIPSMANNFQFSAPISSMPPAPISPIPPAPIPSIANNFQFSTDDLYLLNWNIDLPKNTDFR